MNTIELIRVLGEWLAFRVPLAGVVSSPTLRSVFEQLAGAFDVSGPANSGVPESDRVAEWQAELGLLGIDYITLSRLLLER